VATIPRIALLGVSLLTASVVEGGAQDGTAVTDVEYEGWRQYNVHCARCHGQDALPNPVTADLLTSLAPGGPAADPGTFTTTVMAGRTNKGMPAFKGAVEPAKVEAVYHYLKGRAEKRIPAGRPKRPGS
jgi:mono/diheme cytochrome c family protein